MGSRPRRPRNFPARRSIGKSTSLHYRRRSRPHCNKSTITTSSYSSVSDKLEALKNLIPAGEIDGAGDIGSADQLFQETADYILFLRTKVSVLQKLVDFYGSSSSSEDNLIVQQ